MIINFKQGKKTIASHVQMPKCVLKHFINEYQSFYYYDINEINSRRKIKSGRPASLNTKNGYYSNEVEHLLQKNVESPLGTIIQYIINNDFSGPIETPCNFREIALTYIHSLIARAPHMYSMIEKNSVFFQFCNNFTETEKNDFAVILAMQEDTKNSPFENCIATIVVNNTSIPFVLPVGGMYVYGNIICAPISNNRAIALVKKDTKLRDELIEACVCKVLLVEKEGVLHQMNLFAIQAEVDYNKQYVVSSNKELLEKYLKELSLV